ncbi:hypothetical protein E2C01_068389 [Portunus trituberculatus]|uniref:Uncharacterized protein n=1 Tax=Portunus trituberculatus TaxID=210409 RepID=A0A5B7HZX3_PORTR|nr:hypothetical protein [Portunus trituberculatus]
MKSGLEKRVCFISGSVNVSCTHPTNPITLPSCLLIISPHYPTTTLSHCLAYSVHCRISINTQLCPCG